MSKEIELARTATRGVFHIFTGKIISRVVGIVGGIILIRLLADPEKYGIISIAGVAPQILLLFTDFGVDTAITKYLSEYRSKNEIGNLKPLFYSGLIFKIAIGSVLTVLCFLFAETFASLMLGKPYMAPLIQIASLLIFAWALSSFSESVFLGFDSTGSYAILMILNEVLLSLMPIALVLYGMGVPGALIGMVIATLITSLIQILTSVLITIRVTRGASNGPSLTPSLKSALRKMLNYGIPVGAVVLIGAGLGQYYNYMIATYCTPHDMGNYSVAQKSAFIDYIAWPISVVIFPMFSKISYKSESAKLKKTLRFSVKYSSFLILPVATVLVVLARPLVIFLFGIEYEGAWIYLTLQFMGRLTYGFGGEHLRKLLLSQGETKFIARLDTLTATIGIIAGLILIPIYGVLGLLIMSLVIPLPSYFFKFKKAYSKYGVKPPLKEMGRLYLSITITGAVVAIVALIPTHELLKLALGLPAGMITYVISALVTNAINKDDIYNLKEITKTQPFINVIADKVLNIMEKVITIK